MKLFDTEINRANGSKAKLIGFRATKFKTKFNQNPHLTRFPIFQSLVEVMLSVLTTILGRYFHSLLVIK